MRERHRLNPPSVGQHQGELAFIRNGILSFLLLRALLSVLIFLARLGVLGLQRHFITALRLVAA